MSDKPRPQTEFWGSWYAIQRRAFLSVAIGVVLAFLPAVSLTDGLPIAQRLWWIAGAILGVSAAGMWLMQISSGEPSTSASSLEAETALAEIVGDPAVIVAVRSAPDLEQRLQDAQGLSTLTVPPAALIAVGPRGVAVGPSKPKGGVTQVIDRGRVDDVSITVTREYEQWPSITLALRSKRGQPVIVEFLPASRLPVSQWTTRRLRPVEADEREVGELVSAMRSALGLSVA